MYSSIKKRRSKILTKSILILILMVLISLTLINLVGVNALDIGAKGDEKYFNGTIDEFKIWNISLNEQDIYQH